MAFLGIHTNSVSLLTIRCVSLHCGIELDGGVTIHSAVPVKASWFIFVYIVYPGHTVAEGAEYNSQGNIFELPHPDWVLDKGKGLFIGIFDLLVWEGAIDGALLNLVVWDGDIDGALLNLVVWEGDIDGALLNLVVWDGDVDGTLLTIFCISL